MESNDTIISFDAHGLRLDTSEHAEQICREIRGKNVEVLILQGNTFGVEAAERLGIELESQSSLREAHFKDLFTSRGREEVPVAIEHILRGVMASGAQLTLLDLSDNAIGPIGAPPIIEFLESESAQKLEKLYLNNCGLGPEGSTSISMTIGKLEKLREFICGRNRLENKGATNMSQALMRLNKLEVLKLNQNGIHCAGIAEISKVIENNHRTIREIDLSDNTIKAEGSEALLVPLTRARNLKILRLNDSLLENTGFSIICDALSKSPSLPEMIEASFEGNELHGQKIIDLIQSVFIRCNSEFNLILLENDFETEELLRLSDLGLACEITVDDPDSEYDDSDESTRDDIAENGLETDTPEEGQIGGSSSDDDSQGYLDLGVNEVREIVQDFIREASVQNNQPDKVKRAFMELISTGRRSKTSSNYQAVQILCEELGLIKCEWNRKKKDLARDAIVYIGKNRELLPKVFKDFLEVVVKNNDDLSCGKLLFGEFQI